MSQCPELADSLPSVWAQPMANEQVSSSRAPLAPLFLPQSDPFLALEADRGELLYRADPDSQAAVLLDRPGAPPVLLQRLLWGLPDLLHQSALWATTAHLRGRPADPRLRQYPGCGAGESAGLESREADRQVFNVVGGRGYAVDEFADMVARVFGKDIRPNIPGLYRFGNTRHIVSDASRLRGLGWSPRYTPEDSVRDYVAWFRQQENVEDIIAYAERHMRELNVVRPVSR